MEGLTSNLLVKICSPSERIDEQMDFDDDLVIGTTSTSIQRPVIIISPSQGKVKKRTRINLARLPFGCSIGIICMHCPPYPLAVLLQASVPTWA
jgi:hypothetical protein